MVKLSIFTRLTIAWRHSFVALSIARLRCSSSKKWRFIFVFYIEYSPFTIHVMHTVFPQYDLHPNKKLHYKSQNFIWPNGQRFICRAYFHIHFVQAIRASNCLSVEKNETIPGPLSWDSDTSGVTWKKIRQTTIRKKRVCTTATPWGIKKITTSERSQTQCAACPLIFFPLCLGRTLGRLLHVCVCVFFPTLLCHMCIFSCCLFFNSPILTSIWWLRWVFSADEFRCSHQFY